MESLLIHEGSPGHHFQISIARELEHLPRLRRFGGYTAYAEGWGLYAETLGKELGLYTDPYQYFGYLSSELWRAIRLVLDTGIHAKGWTLEQAMEYARRNSSNSETSIQAEVERFAAIPGQALAYKIGQMKITELRRRAEAALGPRFDIKAFHRAMLERRRAAAGRARRQDRPLDRRAAGLPLTREKTGPHAELSELAEFSRAGSAGSGGIRKQCDHCRRAELWDESHSPCLSFRRRRRAEPSFIGYLGAD